MKAKMTTPQGNILTIRGTETEVSREIRLFKLSGCVLIECITQKKDKKVNLKQ